jgi:hypothetical protein
VKNVDRRIEKMRAINNIFLKNKLNIIAGISPETG